MSLTDVESSIRLVTEVPGPKSQAIVARREAATPAGASKLTPIAIERAHGAIAVDVDGNHYIDLAGGIGMLAVGHTPPALVEAIKRQADQLVNMCAIVSTMEPMVELCETLNDIFPGPGPNKSVLMNSGAEAVETAINIARAFTGRQGVVVFDGAYHGRTNLTMSMTSKFGLFKRGFGPFAPEVYRFPFPNTYRRPDEMSVESFVEWHVKNLEHCFTAVVEPSHVAAIVIEPVQGEAGFVPAPAAFVRRLREIADEHGILLIADEIQAGMGRTGTLWSIEHSGVVPDLLTTAKSLAAGMPLSAVVGRADVMSAPHPGGLGGTYSGNPIACVAALEAIRQINTPEFLARANQVGERLRSHLEAIAAANPGFVGDVRGVGPMLVMEIVKDASAKTPWMEATAEICAETVRRGVITIRAGLFSNCVRFLPPLTISDAEIDEAMAIVAATVADVATTMS